MADFLYCTRRRAPGSLSAALRRFLDPVCARTVERHGEFGSLAVLEGEHDGDALIEDDRGTSALAGDPLVVSPRHGRGPVCAGGRRADLHGLLLGETVDWARHVDGHFAALGLGPGGVRLLTDRFAFVPVFEAETGDGGRVIGTHVDAVAAAAGRAQRIDPVSAADLVANLTCTPPWTLYDGVRQCDAATQLDIAHDGARAAHTFWAPTETNPYRDVHEAAAALRDALCAGVGDATSAGTAAGLLLSGGEDSRAVLGAVPPGCRVHAVTWAEWASREVRIAQRAAHAYGAGFHMGIRPADHYPAGFEATAGLVGSHHLFVDVHGHGLYRDAGLHRLPVVLGGLSADSLLKGTYSNGPSAQHRVLAGLDAAVQEEVANRRRRQRERLAAIRPETADEWMSLWPFSMRKHGGNVDGNRRQFRVWEAFHAGAVLDVAAAVPTEWKRGRRLFHEAVRPLLNRSWYVPHAELRFPWFGRLGNTLLVPGLAIARGLRAVATGGVRARHRPWPKWHRVARSAAMTRRMRESPPWQSPVRHVFGAGDERALGDAIDAWPALSQLMLIQLAHLTRLANDA